MGKSLIIKGADFSANGIPQQLDITSIVGSSANWFPQSSLQSIAAGSTVPNVTRSCVQKYDLSNIEDISSFAKIKVEARDGFNVILLIHDGEGHDYNVNGEETYNTTFAWDNFALKIADLSYLGYNFKYFSLNIRFSDNTTSFPANAVLSNYVKVTLL